MARAEILRLLAALLVGAPFPGNAAILCVKPGGGSGCHATITSALAAADDGDTIRIAAGTYAGNLLITENVTLEGGWNPTFTERSFTAFPTIILPSEGATTSVVSVQRSTPPEVPFTPVLDGLTIAGGRADSGNKQGGGLRLIQSDAQVRNCRITGNAGFLIGGGIWVQGGSPSLEGCHIEDNRVVGPQTWGAGIAIENASATVANCSLINNRALAGGVSLGGGVAILIGTTDMYEVRISASSIEENLVQNGYGGGVSAQSFDTTGSGAARLSIDRVLFKENTGGLSGGAVYVDAISFEITNSVLAQNHAFDGSAIYASDFSSSESLSPGVVRNSTLIGTGMGSAIDTDSPIEVVNSIVRGHAEGIVYAGPAGGLVVSHAAFSANGANVVAGGFALDASNLLVDPRLDASHHLLPDSPLIDAGWRTPGPFADVDGEPRPMAGPSGRFALDIGADEAPGEAQRVFRVDRGEFDLAIAGAGVGHAVLGGDWSGDSSDDLLVAARDQGRAFGLLGFAARRLGLLDLGGVPPADLEIRIQPAEPLALLAGGDLDDDGRRDVALGSPAQVRVLAGGPALGGTRSLPPADFTLLGAGVAELALGDLSGDGIADLVVGDPAADDASVPDAGAVHVILGRPGLTGARNLAILPADVTIRGPASGAALGSALALGDLDGDGDLDLAASDATHTHLLFGPLAAGTRRLAAQPADARIAQLGSARLIALDVSGEGKIDLVGAQGARLRALRGPFASGQQLDAASGAALELSAASAFTSLAAGDVLGDARAELLAGTAGSAYALASGAIPSGAAPIDQLASLALEHGDAASLLGAAVGAADLDTDGRRDLVAGAPGAGRAYVTYGGLAVDNCPGRSNPDQADLDADGAGDACDACPRAPDPLQLDRGAPATPGDPGGTRSDGIGDACQCGDVDGDGGADAADRAAIRAALTGSGSLLRPAQCNVRGPASASPMPGTGLPMDCSLVDAAVLARQIAGLAPGVAQACAAAIVPGF